ncbi:MAG: GNAT family N-acetyltransferase [Peptostreptococcus sp.]|uniref:GNAT family N-acetyltransferase n=1 Tax=Peptostreptococcus sp. TaxID=1262 RepID=UPI002FCAAE28
MKKIIAKENNFDEIVDIWERSVKHSHKFLSIKEIEDIKSDLVRILPNFEINLWIEGEEIIGFSSDSEKHLNMLFLDPKYIGKGYGSKIINTLIEEGLVDTVDVNKDNNLAKEFYLRKGFKVFKESPLDDEGRPYPILHLKL